VFKTVQLFSKELVPSLFQDAVFFILFVQITFHNRALLHLALNAFLRLLLRYQAWQATAAGSKKIRFFYN
jgi:hypothetical protein